LKLLRQDHIRGERAGAESREVCRIETLAREKVKR
jgi:hypothetical protein